MNRKDFGCHVEHVARLTLNPEGFEMSSSPAAGKPGDTRPPVRPELIGVDTFAELLGVSTRHIRRLVDGGKCPAPLRLGKCVRFSRVAVERWIADGCPRVRTVRAGGAA